MESNKIWEFNAINPPKLVMQIQIPQSRTTKFESNYTQ